MATYLPVKEKLAPDEKIGVFAYNRQTKRYQMVDIAALKRKNYTQNLYSIHSIYVFKSYTHFPCFDINANYEYIKTWAITNSVRKVTTPTIDMGDYFIENDTIMMPNYIEYDYDYAGYSNIKNYTPKRRSNLEYHI